MYLDAKFGFMYHTLNDLRRGSTEGFVAARGHFQSGDTLAPLWSS